MKDPIRSFQQEVVARVAENGHNTRLQDQTRTWMTTADEAGYEYNFQWMGRPVIQYPQDLLAMQEIIWNTRPDLIIETGVAHGGMLIFYASMLALLGGDGRAVGIDLEIRSHNRQAIEQHPMYPRIQLIEGSSISSPVLEQVSELASRTNNLLVCLDSNHTHDHVLAELRAYGALLKKDNYLVVFDTSIEDLPGGGYPNRPWGKGDNPKTAVVAFLEENPRFEIDKALEHKLMITSCPNGFLKYLGDPS